MPTCSMAGRQGAGPVDNLTAPGQIRQMPPDPYKHYQMQQLAYKMAGSGDYLNWKAIERDLGALGYRWANQLFTSDSVKAEVDDICRQARTKHERN